MQSASTRQKFVVDQKGRRSAIILPLREYEQLMEDLHDLAVVAERRKEVPIDLADLKRRLKRRAPV